MCVCSGTKAEAIQTNRKIFNFTELERQNSSEAEGEDTILASGGGPLFAEQPVHIFEVAVPARSRDSEIPPTEEGDIPVQLLIHIFGCTYFGNVDCCLKFQWIPCIIIANTVKRTISNSVAQEK